MVNKNSIIRSADVVEVEDTKVLSAAAHANLSVIPDEPYNSVLTKVADRLPTASQKEALDATLSSPSALNPVVLKDDLETYIPEVDLGEMKDSVQNFVDLPLAGNTEGDLRPVIADNIIYRWDGAAWTIFIRSGTFDHTQLNSQNSDPQYQHLNITQVATLLGESHFHSNLAVLAGITDVGSGNIITDAERARIPTTDQVDALKGTYGTPSNTNRYVTSQDPRLNTVRNPYVTVGPPASLATYTGTSSIPFEQALFALDVGSATSVKGIEILPGTYEFTGTPLSWTNTQPLLMAAVPGTVTLEVGVNGFLASGAGGPITFRGIHFIVTNYTTYAVLTQRDGSIFEDCTFISVPLTNTQVGLVLEANNCKVRRCTFDGYFLDAIKVKGNNCIIEDCTFDLVTPTNAGVHILSGYNNTKVVRNTFASGVVLVEGSYAEVLDNYLSTWVRDFGTGTRALGNMPEQYNQAYVGITKSVGPLNSYADYRSDDETGFVAALADLGTSSRYVCTISVALQAVVTTSVNLFKTGGRVFFTSTGTLPTGLTEGTFYYVTKTSSTTFKLSATPSGPFIATTAAGVGVHYVHSGIVTLEVLPGTYTFSNTVSVPVSCRIKGNDSSVVANVNAFNLAHAAGVEGISFSGTAAGVVASSVTGAAVERCIFDLTAPAYGVELTSCTESSVRGCRFEGINGYHSVGGARGVVEDCVFSATTLPMVIATGTHMQVRDNYFTSTISPQIQAADSIIEGNHFLGTLLPSKINTTSSIWQSNYPMQANNIDGVDEFVIDLMGYLEPITPLCSVGNIANTASISFDAVNASSAATPLIPLGPVIRTDQPYFIDLVWTSASTSGVVDWEITTVYVDKDTGVLGTSNSIEVTSARTGASTTDLDELDNVDCGSTYGGWDDVSHVAVTLTRKGNVPSDTMTQSAHLVAAKIRIPRD